MKRSSLRLLPALAAIALFVAFTPPPDPARKVWRDDFDGNTLDTSRWVRIGRGKADWNNYMSLDERLVELREGCVRLWAVVNPDRSVDTVPYLTGGISTRGKVDFNDGMLEIRARLGSAQGYWPAMWMLPNESTYWPGGGEIDIMEHLNSDSVVYQTIHTNYTLAGNGNDNNPPHYNTAPHRLGDWNRYGVDMFADSLVFYVNGLRNFAYPRVDTIADQFPFADSRFYLMLDSQVGGSWVGRANADDYPVCIDIDYVLFTPHGN